jgi:hypothetical protein
MDVGDILVEFHRTGGRAGSNEHLVVGRDGRWRPVSGVNAQRA